MTVIRDKNAKTFDLSFDPMKEETDVRADRFDTDAKPHQATPTDFGLSISDGPKGGAMIRRIAPNSGAAESLAPGDVVVEANKVKVQRAEDLARALSAKPQGQPALLKVERMGQSRWVAIER